MPNRASLRWTLIFSLTENKLKITRSPLNNAVPGYSV